MTRRPTPHQACLFLALLLVFWPLNPANGEQLIATLSSSSVSIESNFTGTQLTLFGAVVRDAATVSRRKGYDVIVLVRGPRENVTVRRKARFAGIWINRDSEEFIDVPAYLAVLSNRRLRDIAPFKVLDKYQLGLSRIVLLARNQHSAEIQPTRDVYLAAALRLFRRDQLYREDPSSVTFITPELFRSQIVLPANIPVGRFEIEMFLFRDNALLQRQLLPFTVKKSGFERFIYDFSVNYSLLYGIAAVIIAMFAGWFAGVVFRRD